MPKVIHHIKYNRIYQLITRLLQPVSHPVSHRTQLARRTRFSCHIRTSRFLTTASVCALILLLLLTLNLFIPIDLESEKTEAATGTATASETSLTITSASSVASVDLTVNNSNGTVATSTDASSINFNVTTNNYTGYTLSISANDDNGLLINNNVTTSANTNSNGSTGDTNPTSGTSATLSSIETTTADFSSTNFTNKWGYKPNKYKSGNTIIDNTGADSVFLPSPTTTATTLNETAAANGTTTHADAEDNYTIALGARADYTKPAGTYTNTFILSVVSNADAYLHFDSNGGTAITPLAAVTAVSSLTLPVPDYYRTGYGFLGWSFDKTAADNIDSSTIYGPNETIDASKSAGMTLYAIWLKSSGNMQNWTGCSSLTAATYNASTQTISYTANTFIALTDTRQSNHGSQIGTSYQDTYAIARLTDGNCWMIENLRLGGSTPITLTTADSQSAGTVQATTNSFCNTTDTACLTTQQMNASNTLTTASERTANSRYLYGNYYSWAQTINTTESYSSYDASPQDSSICPSGWRLPLGGGSSQYGTTNLSFGVLSTSQGGLDVTMRDDWSTTPTGSELSARFRALPNNSTYSGYWDGSSSYSQNWFGYYYSATASDISNARYLGVGRTTLDPGTYNTLKYRGKSIRCVQDYRIFMQDLNDATLANLLPSTGSSATVYDKRDNKAYTIAKLADGKYWMTSNLDLAGGTKLYSDTSDVADGYPSSGSTPYYTLPASSTSGFSSDTDAYVYNSNSTTCGDGSPCYSYYSWLAATAGGKDSNGTAVTGNGYNAAYSVCPKGWKLPTSTTSNANAQESDNWKTGDWYAFATAYGANLASQYYDTTATFYNNVNGGAAAGKAPVYLLITGAYNRSAFEYGDTYGNYWSRTSSSSTAAYNMYFSSSHMRVAYSNARRHGFSVRCVFGG